ncbi:MAG: hypothetical protein A2169_08560 [Deltaproteobacteria bacterium RBG_13_47_9]|nr:MAG: hypothetical protein A2169_08560 [Deltaproteobacteria bacterium RBG_13_47_9]
MKKGEGLILPLLFLTFDNHFCMFKNKMRRISNLRTIKSKTTIFIFVFIFLFPIFLSYSQPSSMRMGPGMGMRQWRKDDRCRRASELNLSSEQIKRLEPIEQTFSQEIRILRVQLFSKRLELREFLTNPIVKQESVRAKYGEMIELQSKLEEKVIDYLIKLRNLLTQEQLIIWCPEKEFPFFMDSMHGHHPRGPMPHWRPPFDE